jgi:hypothetical protein
MRLGKAQRRPVYWLCAHRYTGSMNLTQALKENMGDPEDKERSDTSLPRKSDEAIVVKKPL